MCALTSSLCVLKVSIVTIMGQLATGQPAAGSPGGWTASNASRDGRGRDGRCHEKRRQGAAGVAGTGGRRGQDGRSWTGPDQGQERRGRDARGQSALVTGGERSRDWWRMWPGRPESDQARSVPGRTLPGQKCRSGRRPAPTMGRLATGPTAVRRQAARSAAHHGRDGGWTNSDTTTGMGVVLVSVAGIGVATRGGARDGGGGNGHGRDGRRTAAKVAALQKVNK